MVSRPKPKPPGAPGHVRIIGGLWRGRKLMVADRPGLRPTPDRVRETLFNWLTPHLSGARVLDLCAGTGVLGLECLSRGAASASFVEADAIAAQQLRTNIDVLKATNAQVFQQHALSWLAATREVFDLVFMDPPYDLGLHAQMLGALRAESLGPQAMLYLEWPAVGLAPNWGTDWQLHRQLRAGALQCALLRRVDSALQLAAPSC